MLTVTCHVNRLIRALIAYYYCCEKLFKTNILVTTETCMQNLKTLFQICLFRTVMLFQLSLLPMLWQRWDISLGLMENHKCLIHYNIIGRAENLIGHHHKHSILPLHLPITSRKYSPVFVFGKTLNQNRSTPKFHTSSTSHE